MSEGRDHLTPIPADERAQELRAKAPHHPVFSAPPPRIAIVSSANLGDDWTAERHVR